MTLPVPYSYGQPIQPAASADVQIGDVRVNSAMIFTPVGVWPVRGSHWAVVSQPVPVTTTAGWGIAVGVTSIIIAVLGVPFTCGFSLFFLAGCAAFGARTRTMSGPVMISIQAGGYHYTAQEHVADAQQIASTIHRVNYAQALAAR